MLKEFLSLEGNITNRQLSRIYANVGDSTVGAVLSAVPHDYIAMTYVDRRQRHGLRQKRHLGNRHQLYWSYC